MVSQSHEYHETNKIVQKEFTFESTKLAQSIISSQSKDQREAISSSLFNSKMLLKDDLVTAEQYTKLMNRFNIKNNNVWHRFFRNFGLG